MTRALYDKYREGALNGLVAWGVGTGGAVIKLVLVDMADYTLSLSTHEFLSDIPVAARVATTAALTGKTIAAGVADADNTQFSLATGDQSEAIVVYADSGVASTSRLIMFTDEASGLPVQPNGGNIAIEFASTADRIFRL